MQECKYFIDLHISSFTKILFKMKFLKLVSSLKNANANEVFIFMNFGFIIEIHP